MPNHPVVTSMIQLAAKVSGEMDRWLRPWQDTSLILIGVKIWLPQFCGDSISKYYVCGTAFQLWSIGRNPFGGCCIRTAPGNLYVWIWRCCMCGMPGSNEVRPSCGYDEGHIFAGVWLRRGIFFWYDPWIVPLSWKSSCDGCQGDLHKVAVWNVRPCVPEKVKALTMR